MGRYYLKSTEIVDQQLRDGASVKLLYVSRASGPLELVKQSPSIRELEDLVLAKVGKMHHYIDAHDEVIFEVRTGMGHRVERLICEYSEEVDN